MKKSILLKMIAALLAVQTLAGCAAVGSLAGTKSSPAESASSASAASSDASSAREAASETASAEAAVEPTETSVTETVTESAYFTQRDLDPSYTEAVAVTLADGDSSANGGGVTVDGDTVTITQAGTYVFTGTLTDGQIRVDAPDDAKVQIVLNGVSVTSEGSAALYALSGDKVFLTLAEGTENALISAGDYVQTDDNTVDGAIFAKTDLTINGSGSLTVSSETGHGVVCKDDLKITGGTLTVTAARHGLSAHDSIRVAAGTLVITSGKDGMQVTEESDGKGYLYLGGGEITITCGGDGLQAAADVLQEGGSVTITAGGGSANGETHTDWGMPGFGGFDTENDWENSEFFSDSGDSSKGVKGEQSVTISGGTLTVDSADDSVHSNGEVTVTGGALQLVTGDDGIHADERLTISGGSVTIDGHEGLEAYEILISGGDIDLVTDDDGINASGGSGASLTISGGTVRLNAEGDGLDANGNLRVTGGTVIITGPSQPGNGILDYDGTGSITGGTVLATGTQGMQVNFDGNSTQGSILYTLNSAQAAGSTVTLTDADGGVIAEYTAQDSFQVVLLSTPEIQAGETYTLTAGSETVQIEMTSLQYGSGSGFGGFGGMGGGPGSGGFGGKGRR